jgi:hypothetical protein
MYAIVMAESGGNAQSLNDNAGTGDLSYGLAQINMLGSMGPQRLQEFGLKSNADLYDPLTNLKVAYALSSHGTDFSPWSTYKSGAYQQYLGQSGATVTSGGSGYAAAPAPTWSDYKSALGPLVGLLTGVPELNHQLELAVQGGWSVAKFQQSIEATNWYRTHNDSARQLVALQYSDPTEYKTRVANAAQQVSTLAGQMGVSLTAGQISSLSQQFLVSGWSTQTLQYEVGKFYNGSPKGQAAGILQQMQQTYADYGVPISQGSLEARVRQVLEGATTADTYKEEAIQTAKSLYPSIALQLDSGLTVKNIADPYIQQMSNILEVDPNTVGVTDPLIKKALQGSVVTANGKSTATSTPLWQFEQTLRSDPRWSKTQNARDTVSTALVKLGGDFGYAV